MSPEELEAIARRPWYGGNGRGGYVIVSLDERDGLVEAARENERHRRANLVRAVSAGYDEWVTEAINAEDWDVIPWRVAERLRAELVEAARERDQLRAALAPFVGCPLFGHMDETPRRRVDCGDDQCLNPEHVRYVMCKHPSHAARAALAGSGE